MVSVADIGRLERQANGMRWRVEAIGFWCEAQINGVVHSALGDAVCFAADQMSPIETLGVYYVAQ